MSQFLERAKELRAITDRHYNCAQAVLIPFAEAAGLDHETAYRLAANFASGMKRGATCGAITGGLMALGLYGLESAADVQTYHRRLRESHDNQLDCADLLRVWAAAGNQEKKPHCDAMVFECVTLCETLLRERGKL